MYNPVESVYGHNLVLLITVTCCSGFLLYGYDEGVFAGLNVLPWFATTFNKSEGIFGTINAIFMVGAAGGAMISFLVGNILGRRRTIFLGSIFAVVGSILQGTAVKVEQLLVGRIISGLGVGIYTSTVGLWQAETTPKEHRGRYMSLQVCIGGTGFFLSTWINYGMHNNSGRSAFMFPLLFQLIFVTACGSLVLFMPESPHWLVTRDRSDEALVVLARLKGCNVSTNDPEVLAQYNDIVTAKELEDSAGRRLGGIFSNGPTQNFRRIVLGSAVEMFFQMCGTNSISFYVPTLATQFIGASRAEALWIGGLSSVVVIVFASLPVIFLDRIGRRPFMYVTLSIQAICFAIVAALLARAPPGGSRAYGIAIMTFIFTFYAANNAWFPVSWVYPGEIMPIHLREKGMAIATVIGWLFDFLIVQVTPIALGNIGYKFYVILCVFNVLFALLVYFFFSRDSQ